MSSPRIVTKKNLSISAGCIFLVFLGLGLSGIQGEEVPVSGNDEEVPVKRNREQVALRGNRDQSPVRENNEKVPNPNRGASQQLQPWQADAELNDVLLIGQQQKIQSHERPIAAFAAGNHGVLLRSADGGKSWSAVSSGTRLNLRSIHFVSGQMGWVAGGNPLNHSSGSEGVVLSTQDGGETWKTLARGTIPAFLKIRFFNQTEGIAITMPDGVYSTGLAVTSDGGMTWSPFVSAQSGPIRDGDWIGPDSAVLVGLRGTIGDLRGSSLILAERSPYGIRQLGGVDLQSNGPGWLVGDGGLVQITNDQGGNWKSPPRELPEGVDKLFDFRCVHARNDRVWIAGRPGRIVWHSSDRGKSWSEQRLPSPLPVNRIHFLNEQDGIAVGVGGNISWTDDGGETWHLSRGGNRAALLLGIVRPEQFPAEALARYCADQGYLGVVSLLARPDLGPDGGKFFDLDLRFSEASSHLYGLASEISWKLPVDQPGIDRHEEQLIAYLNQWTEGKLEDTLVGECVLQIRMWQPDVLVLPEEARDDALSRLVRKAWTTAIKLAADPTYYLEQMEQGGLETWEVKRVALKTTNGERGSVLISGSEFLPRVRMPLSTLASEARDHLLLERRIEPTTISFRWLNQEFQGYPDFFSGLVIAPGSINRRQIREVDPSLTSSKQASAKRLQIVKQRADQIALDPIRGANLLSEAHQLVRSLPPEQAAAELLKLGDLFRVSGQWEQAEAMLTLVLREYPKTSAARDAGLWLLRIHSSEEVRWRRLKQGGPDRDLAGNSGGSAGIRQLEFELGEEDQQKNKFVLTGSRTDLENLIENWNEAAQSNSALIKENQPDHFRTSEIRFALAAAAKIQGEPSVYLKHMQELTIASGADPWIRAATDEMWLERPVAQSPRPLALCRMTGEKPKLDGVLSDTCWQQADALQLTGRRAGDTFVLLSYDEEFLYFAGRVPRIKGVPVDGPTLSGRRHDEDLEMFDRLILCLDLDRDYATGYEFHVDQRGHTREACFGDWTWNPKWYVATEGDEECWRIECAIPWSELARQVPGQGEIVNVRITRIAPAFASEGWTQPASSEPHLSSSGWIKFE